MTRLVDQDNQLARLYPHTFWRARTSTSAAVADSDERVLTRLTLQGQSNRAQPKRAVQTLIDEDPRAAGHVIDRDREMIDLDVVADEAIIRIITERQPVAKDLRDVMVVQKTISDLEWVGDEARKVANLTVDFSGVDK